MRTLYFKGDNIQPEIVFDLDKNYFKISGKSMLESPCEFYYYLIDWLKENVTHPTKNINLIIDFEWFNISSSKMILYLLYQFEEINKKTDINVSATWFYQEDDMLEVGEDFAVMVNFPFEFKQMELELLD